MEVVQQSGALSRRLFHPHLYLLRRGSGDWLSFFHLGAVFPRSVQQASMLWLLWHLKGGERSAATRGHRSPSGN